MAAGKVTINVDAKELDEAIEKASGLGNVIREVNDTLVELAGHLETLEAKVNAVRALRNAEE